MDKVILIDKPKGWSSFDVVAKVRGTLKVALGKRPKVGHAGTLDPFATGLLILLVGSATKRQDSYMKQDKEYEATIKLGATSTTGDPEGEITTHETRAPKEAEILKVFNELTGEISQTPPIFSAIKINGQRAYKLARKGEKVDLKPRRVKIYKLELTGYNWPLLEARVSCSSGTYIRTLAEQIGDKLQTGAYLTALRRTKIGDFDVNDAKNVESVIKNLRNI